MDVNSLSFFLPHENCKIVTATAAAAMRMYLPVCNERNNISKVRLWFKKVHKFIQMFF